MTQRELMLKVAEAVRDECENYVNTVYEANACDVFHDLSGVDLEKLIASIVMPDEGTANDKLKDDIIEQMLGAMELMQVRLAKAERTIQNICESMMGDEK